MVVRQETAYIRLKWDDKRHLYFEAEDRDKFIKTVDEAIAACRAYEYKGKFKGQFNKLISQLRNWAISRQDKVEKAFLTVRDSGLLFLVVRKSIPYDDDFENELIHLDAEVANSSSFSEIDLEVLALPNCGKDNYGSFCYPDYTVNIL